MFVVPVVTLVATSSNSSEKEKEANLCLMAGDDSSESSVSFNISLTYENYSTLLNVFKGTHEKANQLALSNNRLKGLNSWLENKVSQLEEELMNLKIDFECFEMIHNNSSCDCTEIVKVTFKLDLWLISNASTCQTLLIGKRVNNIYKLNICDIASNMTCLLSKNDDSWLWHRRIAHIHIHHLNKLVYKNLVKGLLTLKFEKNRICDACQKGKQTKTTFKSKNLVSTTRLLELLNMDLFGLLVLWA